ncbi:MAG TPA: hypothetical protein EYP52_10780 [Anaerolineae bacterium]|nr:hypothetical protein [Anaerolineae bacterium]
MVERIVQARERIYNPLNETDIKEARRALKQIEYEFIRSATRQSVDFSALYWLGQIDYTIAESYLIAGDKKNAMRFFESALRHNRRVVKKKSDSSEAHRMVGECIGRLIPLKGWLFAATSAKQAVTAIETAIDLDTENGLAYVTLSTYHLFAPPLFGGSLEKAIASLEQALTRTLTRHGEFLSHFWMAYALSQKGERKQAERYLSCALSIYPHNQQALMLLNHLKGE